MNECKYLILIYYTSNGTNYMTEKCKELEWSTLSHYLPVIPSCHFPHLPLSPHICPPMPSPNHMHLLPHRNPSPFTSSQAHTCDVSFHGAQTFNNNYYKVHILFVLSVVNYDFIRSE